MATVSATPDLPPEPGRPAASPVGNGSPVNPAAATPNDAPVKVSAAQFGGNPTGRKRKDGLKPGSPEAIEADREKERVRKQEQRARLRAENPPALPSRVPITMASPSQPGAPTNQPEAVAEINIGRPQSLSPLLVEWSADDVRELIEQLLPTAEQYLVSRLTKKAAAAKLGSELLKKIESDSRLDEVTRKSLLVSLPRLCAKYLNKSGISAEYKDEMVVALCCLRIVQRQFRLEAKLDELIAATKKKEEETPK